MGFQVTDEAAITAGLEQDILSDDIPIFYQQPSTGRVFYQNRVIAKRAVDETEKKHH
jgi:hypothetical protein